MINRYKVVKINKKALMEAFLEMERQHQIEHSTFLQCMTQLEEVYRNMHRLEAEKNFQTAKGRVERLLFPQPGELLRIREQWRAFWTDEAKTRYRQNKNYYLCEKQFKTPSELEGIAPAYILDGTTPVYRAE